MNIKYMLYGITALMLLSCRPEIRQNQVSGKEADSMKLNPPGPAPAAIAVNRSTVKARILEVLVRDTTDVSLTMQILDVQSSPGYANMAVKGNVYTLSPNYYLDDHHAVADNKKNRDLLSLRNASPGDTLNADIFFDKDKGWFIQNIFK
jgi:hypothetical protein